MADERFGDELKIASTYEAVCVHVSSIVLTLFFVFL